VQLAELDGGNNLVKSYVRGLDLSGTMQGAGGVGGLLAINAGTNGVHFYCHDGNGNVMALINASNGVSSADFDYTPFGRTLRATGPMALVSTLGFSGQYKDNVTGHLLYLFRSYNPETGGWLSRDPLEEAGSLNLYAFVGNSPINGADMLGLLDAVQAYDYWMGVAERGHTRADNGGVLAKVGGWSQAAGATVMTSFIDFWRARDVEKAATKAGDYSGRLYDSGLCKLLAWGHGTRAALIIAEQAFKAAAMTRASHELARPFAGKMVREGRGWREDLFTSGDWQTQVSRWKNFDALREFAGQQLHHWLIPNGRWGSIVPNWLKNQPWNLLPMPSDAIHQGVHGKGKAATLGNQWKYGSPGWFKAGMGYTYARELESILDLLLKQLEQYCKCHEK